MNVAAHLSTWAVRQPDALALAIARPGGRGFDELTAAELNTRCDRVAHALELAGVVRGMRTVLMVGPSFEFFALVFALFKIGAVPVVLDPGMGLRRMGRCLERVEPDAFIGVPRAHVGRLLFGWGRGSVRVLITVAGPKAWGGHRLERLVDRVGDASFPTCRPEPDDTAAIFFTSGSTGPPKGVVSTHRVFAAQLEAVRTTWGIEPGERDLSTVPLLALFGPALGVASIVPDMDVSRPATVDPRRLVEAIEAYGCTTMFASPALIDRLGRHCEVNGLELPTLRRAISAGAAASSAAIQRFQGLLGPGVEIFTPYGATEAMPMTSIGSRTILDATRERTDRGRGVCVGRPVAGLDLEIVRILDEPIETWNDELRVAAGEVGEIVVRGEVVTPSYYGLEAANRLAKIEGRHRTGDLGYLDRDGRLWICGRKNHRVAGPDGTMFTLCCEAVFNVHEKVARSALVGVDDVPVLCVEIEASHRNCDRDALTQDLLAIARAHDHTETIETILYHRGFPVDVRHNTKIVREELAVWARRELA